MHSLPPNGHLHRVDALSSFLFEILYPMPFLDLSAIVVLVGHFVLQQLSPSFSWACSVLILPPNYRKLHLLGAKRHRLTFLPCRRHRHRHFNQTHLSSLVLWFVVMCCGLTSPSRYSEDVDQQVPFFATSEVRHFIYFEIFQGNTNVLLCFVEASQRATCAVVCRNFCKL